MTEIRAAIRTYSTAAVLSLTTRRMFCEHDEWCDLIEWLTGKHVTSAALTQGDLIEMASAEARHQFRQLPVDASDLRASTWYIYLAGMAAEHGAELEVRRGASDELLVAEDVAA